MPKIFAITQVSSRLTLDAQGQTRATFNVANTTSQPLRGRVTPVALQSARAEWLSIEGENERSFAAEQTHQFTVLISAPKGTPPGDYSLRLDCVATHNPDELFTEGPVVAFEVPPPVVVKPFRWWIPALAAVLLILVVGAVWYFGFQDTQVGVPDLVGMNLEQAREQLAQAGLVIDEQVLEDFTETQDDLPPGISMFPPAAGTVLRSNPAAGEKAPKGAAVQLTVEVESTTIPQLINQTTERAIATMQRARLTLGDLSFVSSLPAQARLVLSQDPAPNQRRPVGSPVQISVGTGFRIVTGVTTVKATEVLSRDQILAVERMKKTNFFATKWRELQPAEPNQ